MKRWVLVFALAGGLGCDRKEVPSAEADSPTTGPTSVAPQRKEPVLPRPPLKLVSTKEIPGDAAFHALVDDLARHQRIESSHTGAGAQPSAIYAAYAKLAAAASREQILAMILHERPIVRGYMAQHVFRNMPEDAASVLPLFGDPTPVDIQDGCTGGAMIVANIVADALCNAARQAKSEHAEKVLEVAEKVIRDRSIQPGPRAQALGCLTARDPKRGAAIARELLAKGSLVAPALSALGKSPAEEVAVITPFVADPDPKVRQAAARALGAGSSVAALEHLATLMKDAHRGVQAAATEGYVRHPKSDPARVGALLESPTRRSAAWAIALYPRAELLSAYAAFVAAHPKDRDHSLRELARRDATEPLTELFRDLLTKHSERGREASKVRVHALSYLKRARDEASIPAIANSLNGFDIQETNAAAGALAAIGSPAAIAELEKALTAPSALVRVAAAEGLRTAGAKASAPKISAAATTGDARRDDRLRAIADQLAGD